MNSYLTRDWFYRTEHRLKCVMEAIPSENEIIRRRKLHRYFLETGLSVVDDYPEDLIFIPEPDYCSTRNKYYVTEDFLRDLYSLQNEDGETVFLGGNTGAYEDMEDSCIDGIEGVPFVIVVGGNKRRDWSELMTWDFVDKLQQIAAKHHFYLF